VGFISSRKDPMVTFQVSDMTCGHCASTIARAVAAVDKFARTEVDITRKLVRVSGDAPVADLAQAIRDTGYMPQELEAGPAPAQAQASSGCGCGCGPRKTTAVDAGQAAPSAAGSCCS
jgi:copper chaperone